jgi:predicted transposase/invertase (TIGR01784 family)
MKTDSLFYRLFQTLPRLLFDLAEYPDLNAEQYRFSSVELKQTAFRLDGVFAPPAEHPDWPVFFVEVQFQSDPELYARLFAEVFLYLRQQRPLHPWQAVVIYPTRAIDPGDHPHYTMLLHSGHVTRVYLDEWARPRQTLTQRLIGVLLDEPRQAIVEAQTLLVQARDEESGGRGLATAIVNLVETILVYKLPTLSREEIQTMLELTDTDLKQTRFYQEVFTEGRQEGRQEEGVTLILRQLQRRCGLLTPQLTEQVARLNLSQLEILGEALLEFRGPADLEQWLAVHGREDGL